MHHPLEQLSGEIQHQHCHFPTSARRSKDQTCFQRVRVLEHEESTENWSCELLHKAWAILLRFYVQNDFVCFASLPDTEAFDGYHENDSESPYYGNEHLWVLQYGIPAHVHMADVDTLETQLCTFDELRGRQINTAVSNHGFSRAVGNASRVTHPQYDALDGEVSVSSMGT